jgi:hypothetical protein
MPFVDRNAILTDKQRADVFGCVGYNVSTPEPTGRYVAPEGLSYWRHVKNWCDQSVTCEQSERNGAAGWEGHDKIWFRRRDKNVWNRPYKNYDENGLQCALTEIYLKWTNYTYSANNEILLQSLSCSVSFLIPKVIAILGVRVLLQEKKIMSEEDLLNCTQL